MSPCAAPAVDIVVPVHNEQADLAPGVRRLVSYLDSAFPFTYRVTIADNASTDRSWDVARQLQAQLPGVRALRLEEKGRGRALRAVWSASDADVLAYMDVDLSTDLRGLLPLVAPLLSGHSEVAIGSRLARSARVLRGPKRELISRGYNVLLHATLGTRFSDAQCGFKAIRADRARMLLPLVRDQEWFFDTELLVLAERSGLRIHEVPVDWTDDPDSRVDIVATALADLGGILRLGRGLRFVGIGVLSTLAYAAVYVALRLGLPAQPANGAALLLTAVANTAANRRYTFGVRGRHRLLEHHRAGLLVFAAALALTGGTLAVLHTTSPAAPRAIEVAVLVAANLLATALRFLALRSWVFASRPRADGSADLQSPAPSTAPTTGSPR